ncbi:MAG: LysR substrate-binding domain-containing protein [Thiolinea sp.]
MPHWIGILRRDMPSVSIHSEIGFEEDLMRRLIEGAIDIGLMYTPQYGAGLQVEHLFDETLVLVATEPEAEWPDERYVYVDWGPGFMPSIRRVFRNCVARLCRPISAGWRCS